MKTDKKLDPKQMRARPIRDEDSPRVRAAKEKFNAALAKARPPTPKKRTEDEVIAELERLAAELTGMTEQKELAS